MGAVRFPGGTAAATVPDQQMGKEGPFLLGNDFDQGLLHFHGIRLACEAHAARQTAHMGIDHDSFRQVEGVAENHVGGFASDAGEFVEMFHCFGHLSAVVSDQAGGTAADRFGLGSKKAGGADEPFQLTGRNFGKVSSGAAAGKKGRSDLVDPFVGALGRKDGGDKKLERVGVV